jgi:5'-deoxynucleotidase YfbR-like HD superfamily hydrolase
MNYIQTASGKHFNYAHPDLDSIDIYDIAQALSRESRFNGHTGMFYSVAQHSMLASRIVPPEFMKEALLHDASEAYMKDLPSPLKALLPDYKIIEARVDAAIRKRFGLPAAMSPAVKRADMILLATERRDLMRQGDDVWACLEGVAPLDEVIQPMVDFAAQRCFLNRFMDLLCGEDPRG